MYAINPANRFSVFSRVPAIWALGILLLPANLGGVASAESNVIRNITQSNERLELTVNSSRILTLEKRIPRMVVNNPELLSVNALSANQVQIAARKPGVTQVNLWDEEGEVYSVDVTIYGDVKELEHALQRLFPGASVKVVRLTNSLVLEGFVERPEDVSPIVRLAEDYAPKIVDNITVGGVQQVILKVKVMEVSRTKLRRLGFDFIQQAGNGSHFVSSVSGLLSSISSNTSGVTASVSGDTARFAVVDGGDSFFGFINALQQNNVAKILADPTLTAVSGRPAHFNVGGELPIIIPSGLGQTTVEYKKFGTQIDFVPIVLGNGNIRLEVRPRVSEIDDSRSIQLQEFTVPALTVREVDTGVELKAGQTLALAGLIQTRIEAQERGLPFFGDLPYVGAAFRSVEEEVNEIELLILVTPEFADGMEPHEVPPCGPGMETVSPTNCQLYGGGHLEVPSCGPCGPANFCGKTRVCNRGGCYDGSCSSGNSSYGSGCSSSYSPEVYEGQPMTPQAAPMSAPAINNYPGEEVTPVPAYQGLLQQNGGPAINSGAIGDPAAKGPLYQPRYQMPAAYARQAQQFRPTYQQPRPTTTTPGLIGPVGYDTE